MAEAETKSVSLTNDEVALLLDAINSINIPGKIIEQFVSIKTKLKAIYTPPGGTS